MLFIKISTDFAQFTEKQVVFKMLKQVTPRPDGTPETPDTRQFARAKSVPPASYPPHKDAAQIDLDRWGSRKKRNVFSAPVKKMAGGWVTVKRQIYKEACK